MTSVSVPVQILCRQCSAPLPIEQGTQFVICEFCGTTNVVDKGQTVFHFAVRVTVRENEAEAALRRWMAGNKTIKGLDRQALVEPPLFQYFPMWLVRTQKDGKEKVWLEPAAALSISELKNLTLPAGDLEPFDPEMDSATVEATVPYETMRRWLREQNPGQEAAVREVALVHVPVYQFGYTFKDRHYVALVDGATSQVFANIYPSKWEVPYLAIGAVAFAAYFLASLAPLIGYLVGGGPGLATGAVVYAIAAVVLAIPIFVGAIIISSRV